MYTVIKKIVFTFRYKRIHETILVDMSRKRILWYQQVSIEHTRTPDKTIILIVENNKYITGNLLHEFWFNTGSD